MAIGQLEPPPSNEGEWGPTWMGWLWRLYEFVRANVSNDFFFDVSAGRIDGHEAVTRTSHDTSIGTTIATVGHENGTLHTYSSTADIDTISSDNAADTHDIELIGLDATYAVVTQTVTLNGTTPVTLDTSLFRINCMYNDIGTTLTKTLGVVYLWVSGGGHTAGVPDVAADIRSAIRKTSTISNERCSNSVYTIPKGKDGYIVFGKTTVTDTKALELTFWGGIGHVAMAQTHHIDIKNNNYDYFFKTPQKVPMYTDLEVRASVDVGTAEVVANFDIILVDV